MPKMSLFVFVYLHYNSIEKTDMYSSFFIAFCNEIFVSFSRS